MQGNVHEFCLGTIFKVPGALRNVEMTGVKIVLFEQLYEILSMKDGTKRWDVTVPRGV